jgi:hypothetical protein
VKGKSYGMGLATLEFNPSFKLSNRETDVFYEIIIEIKDI